MDLEIITPFNLVAGYGALTIALVIGMAMLLVSLNMQHENRSITMREYKRLKRDIGMFGFTMQLMLTIMALVVYFSFIVEWR